MVLIVFQAPVFLFLFHVMTHLWPSSVFKAILEKGNNQQNIMFIQILLQVSLKEVKKWIQNRWTVFMSQTLWASWLSKMQIPTYITAGVFSFILLQWYMIVLLSWTNLGCIYSAKIIFLLLFVYLLSYLNVNKVYYLKKCKHKLILRAGDVKEVEWNLV